MGAAATRLPRPRARSVQDPPEAWEQELPQRAVSLLGRGPTGRHPYRPLREADVPASALTALGTDCGAGDLRQLLVIPASVRPISAGRRWRWVSTPTQVLGLGTRAVGLWVARSHEGGPAEVPRGGAAGAPPSMADQVGEIRETIPLRDLAFVEDARILLSGRLAFVAQGRALRVRYSTVARYDLRPALDDVRVALAGEPLAVGEPAVPPLPVKWQILAQTPAIRLNDSGATVLYDEPRTGRRRTRPTLVALTPYELVVAREPTQGLSVDRYGVDSVHVARRRVERISPAGGSLAIRAHGVDLDLDVGERLVAETREAFAGLLPWA